MHLQHSECPELSQNSRIKQAVGVAVTVSAEDTKCSAVSSDFPEDSQNSLPRSERETDSEEANVSFGDRDESLFGGDQRIPRTFSKLAGADRNF